MMTFFMTLQFFATISLAFGLFMMIAGISDFRANPGVFPGYSKLSLLSTANLNYSSPVCI